MSLSHCEKSGKLQRIHSEHKEKGKNNYCADMSLPIAAKRHSRAKRGSVADFNN